jgi:hypothetical protein
VALPGAAADTGVDALELPAGPSASLPEAVESAAELVVFGIDIPISPMDEGGGKCAMAAAARLIAGPAFKYYECREI